MIITTHERPDDCREAVASVLAQDPPPLEVLICDDGSGPAIEAQLRALATEYPRVRYLRVDPSAGRPAPARNLGINEARGEWVAFLDDDDRWLPGKLATQTEFIEADAYDVIGSDAIRSSGGRYFGPRSGLLFPDRRSIMGANPVITSTAVARRRALQAVRGFETDAWMGGVEDYGLWLRLADRGARFVIIDEPLAIYEDAASSRLSAARLRMQLRLARLKWRRVRASPRDGAALRSALFESALVVRELARRLLAPAAQRSSKRAP